MLLNQNDPLRARLENVVFVAHVTTFEKICLWEKYKNDCTWKADLSGQMCTIGHVAERPICIALSWADLDGQTVLFVEDTSQLVDHKMIDEWLDANCCPRWDNGHRIARAHAEHFDACMSAVREAALANNAPVPY